MRLVLTLAAIHVAEFQITVWPGMIKSYDGKYRFPLLKEDDYKNITRQRKNSVAGTSTVADLFGIFQGRL